MALNLVPVSGQNLDETRVPINDNFTAINSQFAVDHVGFTTGSAGDAGKHGAIHFTAVPGGPVPALGTGEVGLWNGNGTTPFLYLQVGSRTAIDITTLTTSGSQGSFLGSCGLPAGFKIETAQGTTSGGTAQITFVGGGFTSLYSIIATANTIANTAAPIIATVYNIGTSPYTRVNVYTYNASTGAAVNSAFSLYAIGIL